tara:strand:- start:17 stop:934 length:918 start_codon:yes stop_codon:yes gene_type:complete
MLSSKLTHVIQTRLTRKTLSKKSSNGKLTEKPNTVNLKTLQEQNIAHEDQMKNHLRLDFNMASQNAKKDLIVGQTQVTVTKAPSTVVETMLASGHDPSNLLLDYVPIDLITENTQGFFTQLATDPEVATKIASATENFIMKLNTDTALQQALNISSDSAQALAQSEEFQSQLQQNLLENLQAIDISTLSQTSQDGIGATTSNHIEQCFRDSLIETLSSQLQTDFLTELVTTNQTEVMSAFTESLVESGAKQEIGEKAINACLKGLEERLADTSFNLLQSNQDTTEQFAKYLLENPEETRKRKPRF